MNEYLSRGVVTKDAQGRIVGKDGSRIPRDYQEPFAQAIERMLQPRTNFVTLAAGTTPVPTLRYPSDESDFWENARAYPATRSEPKARTARQDAMDKTRNSKDRQGGGNRPAAPLPSQPKPIRLQLRKERKHSDRYPWIFQRMYFILGMTTILWRTLRSGGIISGRDEKQVCRRSVLRHSARLGETLRKGHPERHG